MAKKEKKKKKGEEAEAEAPEAAAPVAEGAEGEAPPKKKLAGKTLVLFIILPALLVLGGGGAVTMMLLGGGKKAEAAEAGTPEAAAAKKKEADKKKKEEADKKKKEGEGHGEGGGKGEPAVDVGHLTVGEDGEPSYYYLPKFLVNLASKSDGDRPQLLELSLILEASDAGQFDNVPAMLPRLKDTFNGFLRELRVEDLDGSAGNYRLQLELLKRFNTVMAPEKVDAVLIDGLLVQ